MEFELNEILDIIEGDLKANCNKNLRDCNQCKYGELHRNMPCMQYKDSIRRVRELAEISFK